MTLGLAGGVQAAGKTLERWIMPAGGQCTYVIPICLEADPPKQGKAFFFEKKKQKTFTDSAVFSMEKSFLVHFFKKGLLSGVRQPYRGLV